MKLFPRLLADRSLSSQIRDEAGLSGEESPQNRGATGEHSSQERRAAEHDLVSRAQRGDREAFKVLVERYQQRAFRLALSVLRDRTEAEDVTQDAFVKAFLSLSEFELKSSFFTWLYRIVMNLAIDARRKKGRRGQQVSFESRAVVRDGDEEKPLSDVLSDGKPSPEESVIGEESMRALRRGMDGLSEEHRAVVLLREVDGLSYDEIAAALGVAKGTVMSRLFYARRRLQDEIEKGDLK